MCEPASMRTIGAREAEIRKLAFRLSASGKPARQGKPPRREKEDAKNQRKIGAAAVPARVAFHGDCSGLDRIQVAASTWVVTGLATSCT